MTFERLPPLALSSFNCFDRPALNLNHEWESRFHRRNAVKAAAAAAEGVVPSDRKDGGEEAISRKTDGRRRHPEAVKEATILIIYSFPLFLPFSFSAADSLLPITCPHLQSSSEPACGSHPPMHPLFFHPLESLQTTASSHEGAARVPWNHAFVMHAARQKGIMLRLLTGATADLLLLATRVARHTQRRRHRATGS